MEQRPPSDTAAPGIGRPDWTALTKYLIGEASPDEQAAVQRWVSASPERAATLDAFRDEWASGRAALDRNDAACRVHLDTALGEFWRQAQAGPLTPAPRSGLPRAGVLRGDRPGYPPPTLARRVAAGSLIALGVTAALFVAVRQHRGAMGKVSGGHQYVTRPGQEAALTLSDGTRIQLAPQSRLTVPSDFGASRREVALTGEAYFDVSHTEGTPFIVRTGAITTRVLGTAFDVAVLGDRAEYSDVRAIRVAVMSGKVASGTGTPAIVSAGRVAHVTDSSAVLLPATDAAQYTTWTTGRLVFHDAPVADVLSRLEQWYGIDFHVADPALRDRHVTATFDTHSRSDALTVLKAVLDVTMTFDTHGDRLTVTMHSWTDTTSPRRTRPVRDTFTHRTTEVGR